MSARVALVVVSHSASLAEGVVELAAAMAPDVAILAAGGLPDGGLGTSFDLVENAVNEALKQSCGAGVAILTDIGSATLTVDAVTEFADDPAHIRYAPGPLVEGAVIAAVLAQQGADLDAVVGGVLGAAGQWKSAVDESGEPRAEEGDLRFVPADGAPEDASDSPEESARYTATIVDADGLHARPAARLAALAAEYDAEVLVNGASAQSMMEIMALGVRVGDTVVVTATGPGADRAAQEVASAIAAGFDAVN